MLTRDRSAKWQPRVEDARLLRGEGRYVDDVDFPNLLFAAFVRSPHSHARIKSIDAAEALRAPGVLAVLTSADMKAAGVDSIAMHIPMSGRGGAKLVVPKRPPLAEERALHVGQPVAVVIAERASAAQDAADLVAIDYEELDSVVDLRAAAADGAPQLWPEAPNNIALDWPGLANDEHNTAEVERIIAGAANVARISLVNQRVAVAPMETRGGTARFDPESGGYTLRTCSQGVGAIRDGLAAVMKLDREKIRVITEDVGGGFGLKTSVYPELPVLLVAAKKLGRPVHWMSGRSESFISDNHARDTYSEAELALDANGKFLALRIRHFAAMGAFVAFHGAHIATNNFARCLPGMYDIPKIDAAVKCVFTNTVQTGPYRGAGRPEANYLLERLVDEAARVAKLDPAEIRRRNFIPPAAMPYKTAVGTVYDSGEFATLLDKGLRASDYAGFEKRRAAAKAKGLHRGVGFSCFLEHAGAIPTEGAALSFKDRRVSLALGVQSTGQGHATVFARLLAERLGLRHDEVVVAQGDSRADIRGAAAVGSRSAMTVSHAIAAVSDAMLAKGRAVAAKIFEAKEAEIAYRDGVFEIPGTNRRLPLFDLAQRAAEMAARGEITESLDTKGTADTPLTFPNGCHIAEAEIDPDTGVVTLVNYTCVDDCGTVLDHVLVEGQVVGAIAQGVGQALLERIVYDDGGGQLITGSFMDYGMPRADDMPPIDSDVHPVPATTNPMGVKGVGEAGTTASLAAIMNAIADAIPNGAGRNLDMPATPEKVWRACQGARAGG